MKSVKNEKNIPQNDDCHHYGRDYQYTTIVAITIIGMIVTTTQTSPKKSTWLM